jgi:hypothetical protein
MCWCDCSGGYDNRSETDSSAVCEKKSSLGNLSVRPDREEKGQVFISVLGAGEVANEARFRPSMMRRCPGPTSEPIDFRTHNPVCLEPEENLDPETYHRYYDYWNHSARNPGEGISNQLESNEATSSDSENPISQSNKSDFDFRFEDFSAEQSKDQNLIEKGLNHERSLMNDGNDSFFFQVEKEDLLLVASMQVEIPSKICGTKLESTGDGIC